jgi:hypothetical protein
LQGDIFPQHDSGLGF